MSHSQAIATVHALLNAGFTMREVAERLQAHPRAIAALAGRTDTVRQPLTRSERLAALAALP